MSKIRRTTIVRLIALSSLALAPLTTTSAHYLDYCIKILAKVPHATLQERLDALMSQARKLTRDKSKPQAEKPKILMAALEIGKVPGLDLNISEGGVAAVMTDITTEYPRQGIDLTVVGVMMDKIDKTKMRFAYSVHPTIDGNIWDIGVYEFRSPNGTKYLFLDNPSFKRMSAVVGKGDSIYNMRGLGEDFGSQLEKQRIFSAINQSIAEVTQVEKPMGVVLHDNHVSPASFYINKTEGIKPTFVTTVLHNENYKGNFYAGDEWWDRARRAWNLSHEDMNRYFMHDNQLVMLNPSLRMSEERNIFTGLSVSEGSANGINFRPHEIKGHPAIEFFRRIAAFTNGFGDENRPDLSGLVAKTKMSEKELIEAGITHPDVIKRFQTKGYQFGFKGQKPSEILQVKMEAKIDLQKNLGMTVDPNKPVYISFARLVEQKGEEFTAQQIEHILNNGGQIITGGPVGDAVGARERQMFLDIKAKLMRENHPNKNDFVFIDGAVKGPLKGLMLAAHDFFIIPSRFEPCGLTDVESAYFGGRAIAHNVGGLSKISATILYGPVDPNNQGWELGQAIDRAMNQYKDRAAFGKSQIENMKVDFSMEKNAERFLQIARIETYGKMISEIESELRGGAITQAQAQAMVQTKVLAPNKADVAELQSALKMMDGNRRTPLINWVINH